MGHDPFATKAMWRTRIQDIDISDVTGSQVCVYILLLCAGLYWVLQRTDRYPLLSMPELFWNALVYATPPSIVMALDSRSAASVLKEGESGDAYSESRTFAQKSEAMRSILGLNGAGFMTKIQRVRSLSGVGSLVKGQPLQTLPGLGNMDNSCYQNSIIQGLASLKSLPDFLNLAGDSKDHNHDTSTIDALGGIIEDLNEPENFGQRLWTPAILKSMSSWTQQDAQEYFSKIFDDLEKEAKRNLKEQISYEGLREVKTMQQSQKSVSKTVTSSKRTSTAAVSGLRYNNMNVVPQNPLEGLIAQRVGCLRCGHAGELSLIPFNCITLPLEYACRSSYEIAECLDKYTDLESIEGVDCGRCTLLHQKEHLQRVLSNSQAAESDALTTSIAKRLEVVDVALQNDDYSENTISKKCQVPKKSRVSSTKSRQAVIARCPSSLVLHVNRSVFDETTFAMTKNNARVVFPETIDLSAWCLGRSSWEDEDTTQSWSTDPAVSLLAGKYAEFRDLSDAGSSNFTYSLRAIIIHQGRHENGHYVCYRRDPAENDRWWRLSDESVYSVSEGQVLAADGVYMLFYERSSVATTFVEEASNQLPSIADAEAIPVDPVAADDVDASPENEAPTRHQSTDGPDADNDRMKQADFSMPMPPPLSDADEPRALTEADESAQRLPDSRQTKNVSQTIAPPMRTAGTRRKRSKKAKQRGLSSMSNMVAAN